MIASNDSSTEREAEPFAEQADLDFVKALFLDKATAEQLLSTEEGRLEFLARSGKLVEHCETLRAEMEEMAVVHELTLEHATRIENELELQNRIVSEDLEVAQGIQQSLMPDQAMLAGFVDIAVYHKQLTEVGGDYYDFSQLPGDRFAVSVYDISGHGVSSALIMTFLKAQIENATKRLDSPSAIVDWVNRASYAFLRGVRRYATVNFVMFSDRFLRYVSGGGYGLLVRHGEQKPFNRVGNYIGLRTKPFREFELPFEEGDVLALYTDGMAEALDENGKGYTVQRLNDLIARHSDEPVQDILNRCVEDYTNFRAQDTDDITLLILRRCAK
jgi:sigma-B regulation protein RsbU (phosphoserine phosphatase)